MSKGKTAHHSLFLLKVQTPQIAVVLLSNALRLKHIVFQFLLCTSGIHDKECHHEHTLILALQLFQECLCILSVGSKVTWKNIHIISGANCLFLFLNFTAVKLCDCPLDTFDSGGLVYRLDVHGNNLAGLHIQKVCQHPVAEIGCRNGKKGHGAVQTAHLKRAVIFKDKSSWRNKVLDGKTGFHQPFPVEKELIVVPHVEHGMHEPQTFLSVQCIGNDSQPAEIVEQIILNMSKPRLCLTHGLCFDTESQIFCFRQTIIPLRELLFQHLAVFCPHGIKVIFFEWDTNTFFKALRIGTHIHEGQFKMDGAVKKIEKTAPFIEDGCFIFLLCQLIVDVLELNGFGVIAVCHTANPIREHSLKRDRLLGCLRNPGIFFRPFNHSLDFFLLFSAEMIGHFYFSFLCFLSEKQSVLPPFRADTGEAVHRSNCRFDMV